MSIRSIIGSKESRVERFLKLAKGRDKEDVRKLEMTLLKPESMRPYTGKAPGRGDYSPMVKLALKVIFHSRESFQLFEKHFLISRPKGLEASLRSVESLEKLIALVEALDRGIIEYDKENKKIVLARERRKPKLKLKKKEKVQQDNGYQKLFKTLASGAKVKRKGRLRLKLR